MYNYRNKNRVYWIIAITIFTVCIGMFVFLAFNLTGCSEIESDLNSLNGHITGNTYSCQFYSNDGRNFMNMHGTKIDMESNVVNEQVWSKDEDGFGEWSITKTVSSVVTITIDGHDVENCGSTILFVEDGLKPDVDFNQEEINIQSTSDSFFDNVFIASIVNRYKNSFGKSRVCIIQSQLGTPICAFSGDDVYWKVCDDLPKTTKLFIDGKALYIHRANFQIIDKELLD